MSSDPGPKLHSPSLLSSSSSTSGAGSTSANTQHDTVGLSTRVAHFNDTNTTPNNVPDDTNAESGPSRLKSVNKSPEQSVRVAQQHHDLESMKEEGEASMAPINQQIELIEHTPDSVVDEGQDWASEGDYELKRVKVYELIGAQWKDQGTAFCFGQFQDETSEALLIARSEESYDKVILSTVIRSNDVYQQQQDTLIVWTEPDGVDYALSFQDPEGCAEVWAFIREVQQHMNGTENISRGPSPPHMIGPEPPTVTTPGILRSGHLPQPTLGIIGEIDRAIKQLARTQSVKERICEYIQKEIADSIPVFSPSAFTQNYIKSLIEVLHTAEDLESLDDLHALCSIMQTILTLNDHAMYEHILEDDLFFGVIGMLEYDPDFPNHKANYRKFLHQTSHFHEPIIIRDPGITRKIHHTYRLQFLKDVVLARALDDSTFNVLNSCIIFNQIDIITHVQADHNFLREIVKLFVDECMLSGGAPAPKKITKPPLVGRVDANGDPIPNGNPDDAPQSPATTNGKSPNGIATVGPTVDANGNSPLRTSIDDANAMEVDLKQPLSSPKANGDGVPHANGRTTPAPAHLPQKRTDHYAFAPPDNMTDDELKQRRAVIILMQQLCIMGKNVQLAARMSLFRALVDRGVLFGVQWAMNLCERDPVNKPMISAAGEILVALLDHDLNGVRGHVLKQVVAIDKERAGGRKGADKAETILEMACRILAQSKDLTVQSQVGDALKAWMDVPPGEAAAAVAAAAAAAAAGTEASVLGGNKGLLRKDDPGTERYMDYFYKDCLHILFKPLFDLPEWRNVKEPLLPLTREETNRYVYLSDLMYNFVTQHHFRIHFYLMSTNVLVRVASLLKARDKHLRHASFRIFRRLLQQNNPNTHAQVMKHDVLKPLLDLTIQESRRDNLLSCSCQDYFDFIRKVGAQLQKRKQELIESTQEKVKELGKFCWVRHEEEIRTLAKSPLGGQRFEQFIAWVQFEILKQNKEPLPGDSSSDKYVSFFPSCQVKWLIRLFCRAMDARGWQPPSRALDAEEESYFNADDDEEDLIPVVSPSWPKAPPLAASHTQLKRKRRSSIGGSTKGYRPPLRTPVLGSLVDYGDDDEDNDTRDRKPLPVTNDGQRQAQPGSSRSPSPEIPASPKLAHRQVPLALPPKRANGDDDEEDLLESLARTRSRPQSPAPGMMASLESLRPSEKRRRGEDEDEDNGLLIHKAKKQDMGTQKERLGFGTIGRTKIGDDPPKKMKLKFGATSLAVAATPSTPVPSETGAKDGDTG
ncbi:hypothetical protein C0991_006241 [Blastosporella zonata]|nr:hypothetical protein C0991_006241 [Blastosporella zonata]